MIMIFVCGAGTRMEETWEGVWSSRNEWVGFQVLGARNWCLTSKGSSVQPRAFLSFSYFSVHRVLFDCLLIPHSALFLTELKVS